MPRCLSKIAPDWWDYTTLDPKILEDAAKLTERSLKSLARPGFSISFYDTLEEFYLAEALEYIEAWRRSPPDNPAGICGPIGPTEQLPLVARIVNALDLNLSKLTRISGAWTNGSRRASRSATTIRLVSPKPTWNCASIACDRRLAHAARQHPFSDRRSRAYSDSYRRSPLRRDAGRPGRGQALGIQ